MARDYPHLSCKAITMAALTLEETSKTLKSYPIEVVLSWGGRNDFAFRAFLAICRDNLPCHSLQGEGYPWLFGGYRLGKLLTFCSFQDSPGQQRFSPAQNINSSETEKTALQSSHLYLNFYTWHCGEKLGMRNFFFFFKFLYSVTSRKALLWYLRISRGNNTKSSQCVIG